jgi:lipopolysaccharide export system protein LptC
MATTGSEPGLTGHPSSAPGALLGDRETTARTGAVRSPLLDRGKTVRYSRLVGWAKLLLPSAAGALLLMLAAWPYLSSGVERLRSLFPKLDITQIRDLRMINPRYNGIDKEQRPFTVTADSARQNGNGNGNDGDLVALEGPKADLLTKEGNWMVVTGDTGIYQPETHFLDLFGHVTMFHKNGYVFRTNSARVDLDSGTAEGHEDITGEGPSGTIEGEGFRILQRGDTVVFTGKSHLTLSGVHGDGAK